MLHRGCGFKQPGKYKPVCRCDLISGDEIERYESIQSAGKWVIDNGLSVGKRCDAKVSLCAKGKRKTAYGYKWKYDN